MRCGLHKFIPAIYEFVCIDEKKFQCHADVIMFVKFF